MADAELQTALGGLTQAIQQLTQNMGRSNYAYQPFSPTSASGGVAGIGGQAGAALGGPMGGLLGGFGGMFLNQMAPQLAAQIGTGPYQNSYYREQNAAVTQQLMQERGGQFDNLARSTGLSAGLLRTGSMLLDTLSPGTFDKIASTLDPSYLSGQSQFTVVQASRLAALRFGGEAKAYAAAFAGSKFDGLLQSDAANAFMMASQTGQGRDPEGTLRAAKGLGGIMSTVASVFGVDGGQAANLMQENGLMNASAAEGIKSNLFRLGAVSNISGLSPQQLLQTAGAMGGGQQGLSAVINAMTVSGGVMRAGGSMSASDGARDASARLEHNMGGTMIGQAANYVMSYGTAAEKEAFKRDPAGYAKRLARTNPQGLRTGGQVRASSGDFDEEIMSAALGSEARATNALVGRQTGVNLEKASTEVLAKGAAGTGAFARQLIDRGLSQSQAANAITSELSRRGVGAGARDAEALRIQEGKATAAAGMASGSLVEELKKALNGGKFMEIFQLIAQHLGVLAAQIPSANTAGNAAPAARGN